MGSRLRVMQSAAHFLVQSLLLPPNQPEVIHHKITADVTVLIANGKDGDRDVAVSDGEVDGQVSGLPCGRL